MMKNVYLVLAAMLGLCTTVRAENWMKYLPDETYVAVVSIPGTHDSATGNGWTGLLGTVGGPTNGQTQDLSFDKQWAIGVRAFDLRPKVTGSRLAVNHGPLQTKLYFDDALRQLRDSLVKNPTEFAVVHMLYAENYDSEKDKYRTMLLDLLGRDDLKDFLVDFRADLTVGEMRGKILLLSRDKYDDKPVGGFFSNWCGYIDWNAQTSARITGASTGVYASSPLYVQDFSSTYNAIDTKVEGIRTMLNFSTKHVTNSPSQIVWVYNFMSAYTDQSVSTSNGYRDNATYTHAAILDYLATQPAGPTGIILMDFAGVNQSGKYATRGEELVNALIENNWKYLTKETDEVQLNKAKYEELLAKIEATKKLRLTIRTQINKECPDVSGDFTADLNAVYTALLNMESDLKKKYEALQLTEESTVETEPLEEELNRILQAALDAQAQKTKYNELQARIDAVEQQRQTVAERIAKECPDVADEFTADLEAVGTSLSDLEADLKKLYDDRLLTEESTVDTGQIEEELDRILQAALDAQAQKTKYDELQAKIDAVEQQRQTVAGRIAKECPDVADEFTAALEAVGTSLSDLEADLKKLYDDQLLTEESTVETEPLEEELDRILQAALDAQARFEEESSGISAVTAGSGNGNFRIYSVSGQQLAKPRQGAVNILKYDDGTVRKVKY